MKSRHYSHRERLLIALILLLLLLLLLYELPIGIGAAVRTLFSAEKAGIPGGDSSDGARVLAFRILAADIAVTRILAGLIFFLLIIYLGYPILSPRHKKAKGALLCLLPAFLIAVNNFPILGLFSGRATLFGSGYDYLLLALECLAIGFFEECCFRGIVFLSFLEHRLKQGKRKAKFEVFYSILLTSAVFGAVHLLNLLEGASPLAVLLQVGYSFLIGGMCAVVLVKTRSLLFPVLIHALFDYGGTLLSSLGEGQIWDPVTVLLTVLFSLLALLFFVSTLYKTHDGEIQTLFSPT